MFRASAGFDKKNKRFNFKGRSSDIIFIDMPMEIKAILKAAKIKKSHLKNEAIAMQTYEIIQKALSSHTTQLMEMLNNKRSTRLSKFTSDKERSTNISKYMKYILYSSKNNW